MRVIDLASWERREHYQVFKEFDHPYFGVCANVDIGTLLRARKEQGLSIFAAVLYLVSRAANEVPQLRQRMDRGQVVEHEVVHTSFTYQTRGELFNFGEAQHTPDFDVFRERLAREIDRLKGTDRLQSNLKCSEEHHDVVYTSCLPWISFTSFRNPLHFQNCTAIPRVTWGKYFPEGERVLLPVSVEVHHALVDGIHVGRFYECLQRGAMEWSHGR